MLFKSSSLAQSVEHAAVNRGVVGSSPTGGVYGKPYLRLHGQAVKTPPFHGGNRGSNPLGVITEIFEDFRAGFLYLNAAIDWYSFRVKMCRCGSIGRAADL